MGAASRFEFVEGATSDLSFEAHGPTLEEAFAAAASAFLAATVQAPDSVARRVRRKVAIEEPDLELLLLRFLNELVYLRDAEELLFHPDEIDVAEDGAAALRADLIGERIDRNRHALLSDVKAATAHGLAVKEAADGWVVRATLDV